MVAQFALPFALIFGVSLVVSLLVTPLARRLGVALDLVDRPGGRRMHFGAVPRLGGIALYAGFVVAVGLTMILPEAWFPPRLDPNEPIRLTGLLLGTTAVFLFGLLDDRFQFPSRPQYVAQLLSALIAIVFIIFIERVSNPFTRGQLVFPPLVIWLVTLFWFTGMINTVNWLDGMDGLADGVAAIMCVVLAIHMIREGQYSVALLPIALLGATLGFLPYNFNPARIFMGSSGSYFLGWALAALGIISGAKMATVLLVMGLPILDVAWLIVSRWRNGLRPNIGARDHLHYRLLDKGFTPKQIALGYYLFSAAFGALALGLGSRTFKLAALVVLAGAALAIIVWASKPNPLPKPDA
jgi:UDP-GlcNAc:undecaprenyl-phosphate/decaprenyl-phosphate GlcNAc-1-phosphate transferase